MILRYQLVLPKGTVRLLDSFPKVLLKKFSIKVNILCHSEDIQKISVTICGYIM